MEVFSRLRRVFRSLLPGDQRQFERQLPPGDPRRTDSLVSGTDDGDSVVSSLVEGGVLVEQGQGVVLSTGYRESWHEAMATLRGMDDRDLADAVATAVPGLESAVVTTEDGRDFVVVGGGDEEPLWLSRPVAIAEVAALRSLPETVDPEQRVWAARPLRLFLESCPDCDGRIGTVDADNWPGANRGDEQVDELLICFDCGERLYSF